MLTVCLTALLIIWAIDTFYKPEEKTNYKKERPQSDYTMRDNKNRRSFYDWDKENVLYLNKYPEFEEFDPSKIYDFETVLQRQKETESHKSRAILTVKRVAE